MILPINKRSLTFIELILVITIIVIASAVSVPQFRKTFDNFVLENLAKDIFYLSRYLQGSAISQGNIHCLNIAKEDGKFWATAKDGDQFQPIKGRFNRVYQTPEGAIIYTEPQDKTEVYFYPDGSAEKINITLENKYNKQVLINIRGITSEVQIK